jgi:hypothetical protein
LWKDDVTKPELLGALNNVLNNFVFGLVLTRIVPESAFGGLSGRLATFKSPAGDLLHVNLDAIAKNMSNAGDRKLLIEEFENNLKRALASEGHEVIIGYCEETNQFSAYKAEPWFQFARIIRNVVSHKDGGVLRNWPPDLTKAGVSKVSWRTRTLEASMVGQSVSFTHHEALLLFQDQLEFAHTKLK